MRRYWIAAHLYVGLSIGLVFAFAGLTGSLLVFYNEIDRLINPELIVVPQGQKHSYQSVVNVLAENFPERDRTWRLEVPQSPNIPIYARYYKPQEKAHLAFAPLIVAINPYTLDIINERFWGDYLMTWIYDLHYTLLMDLTGRTIMGIIGVFCLISVGSGIYLWWPKQGKWRNAFAFRLRSGYLRKLYDIHTLLGIYGLVLLLAIIISGLLLEVPQWFTPLINKVSSISQKPNVISIDEDGYSTISIDDAIKIAKQEFPNAQLRWIETPDDEDGVYTIRLKQPLEVGNRFPKTYVWVNQYNGDVLEIKDPKHNTSGDTFMDWQHPIHSGEAFGLVGRIIVFLTGFIPPILLVTGFLRWRRKLK